MKARQVLRATPGIVTLLALVVAHGVQMGLVQAAAPTETTPNLKVAFLGDQGARPGALFIELPVDGDPNKARGYFKNIDGVIIDEFTIVSDLNNTMPPTPAPPTSLISTAISTSRIDLTWTDASTDEDGFQIERSPDGVASWTQSLCRRRRERL